MTIFALLLTLLLIFAFQAENLTTRWLAVMLLAVAVAITLSGPGFGAARATVVGVLVEVPVMLSVCKICNQSRGWYQAGVN